MTPPFDAAPARPASGQSSAKLAAPQLEARSLGLRLCKLLPLLALSACTGLHLQTRQNLVANTEDGSQQVEIQTETFWRYGNFCGKNHPVLDTRLPAEAQVHALLSIAPQDDVDMACQFHDICYVVNGGPSRVCDKVLGWNLKLLEPSIPKVRKDLFGYFKQESSVFLDGCSRLISEIEHFAEVSAGINADGLNDMLTDGLGGVVMAVVNTPTNLIGAAISSTDLLPEARLAPCMASSEPSLVFPENRAELAELQRCYRPKTWFSNCDDMPMRGRSSHDPNMSGVPAPAPAGQR